MVRFQWHVEEGLGASVGPGQLALLKEAGVLQAIVDIEVRYALPSHSRHAQPTFEPTPSAVPVRTVHTCTTVAQGGPTPGDAVGPHGPCRWPRQTGGLAGPAALRSSLQHKLKLCSMHPSPQVGPDCPHLEACMTIPQGYTSEHTVGAWPPYSILHPLCRQGAKQTAAAAAAAAVTCMP